MARSDIKAGQAYVELLLKNSKFLKGLKSSGKQLTSFGLSVAKIGASVSAAGGLIVAPFVKAIGVFTSVGDKLDKMSQRTGVQASSLAELGFAAEQSGSQLEVVEKGINGMTRALLDAERGSKEAVDSLDDIGLSVNDLKGKDVEEQFQMVANGINSVEDASKRGALAQKLLGRSGRELLPMFGSMESLRQQARDEGLVPTEESVKQAAVLTDAFNVVRRKVGAAFYEVGSAVSGNVLEAVEVVSGLLTVGIKWVKQNGDLLITILKIGAGLIAAGAAIGLVGVAIVGIGSVLTGLATIIGVVGTGIGLVVGGISFMLSPIGLVIGAVGLLVVGLGVAVAAWLRFTESGRAAGGAIMDAFGQAREVFSEFYDIFEQTFGGIKDALIGGDLELAGEIALTGLRLAFLKGIDLIASMFDSRLGGMLKDFAMMVSGGDFAGAWNLVVKQMAALWDGFVSGIVTAFTDGARKVLEVWRKTTTGISDFLLDSSAQGGVMGKVASAILGVDMQKEIERGKKLDRQLGLNPSDILGDAKQGAENQLNATADAIQARIDELETQQKKKADNSRKEADDSVSDTAASDLAAEIERLTKLLGERRAVAARKAAEAFSGNEREEAGNRISTFGSTSAAALLIAGRAGGGVSREERMAKVAEEQKELMKQIAASNLGIETGIAGVALAIATSGETYK